MKKLFLFVLLFFQVLSFSFNILDETRKDIKAIQFDINEPLLFSTTFLIDGKVKGLELSKFDNFCFETINNLGEKDFLILTALVAGITYFDDPVLSYTILESTVFTSVITYALKISIGRGRPYAYDNPFVFKPFSFENKNFSFPSGHSSFAWALFTPLAERYNKVLYVFPFLFSMSRVVGNYHWLSDVIFGAFIGYTISKCFYYN
ncbi:membrane-associated phospholipid phosphatase [Thermosipho japonicus]|uniref:Membrane-associated phospholipid phosphatase n=1 Tax=Thermosipho japonicus TaxID=90323 RepID=A0A841GQ81_9BACT|nr:phosphatase PAP2 family protein [Thermosipho japonicus]MBB6061973.1 membrane-associated phospholipid phosphatase [Thermosipho japonicus]